MAALTTFYPYQQEEYLDRHNRTKVVCFPRQAGKSFTFANIAVDRLVEIPGHTVTVLSNSRFNGAEFNKKCNECCDKFKLAFETEDLCPDMSFSNMRFETRIKVKGKMGYVIVLAANPDTARGFTGDVFFDEFGFQRDPREIYKAAEPFIKRNRRSLARIFSTVNGRNYFWQMLTCGLFPTKLITIDDCWKQGLLIYHPVTGEPISPDEDRALAMDKDAWDENYRCIPGGGSSVLLRNELILLAQLDDCGFICAQDWTPKALEFLRACKGNLYVGIDVGRHIDKTAIAVVEKLGEMYFLRGLLVIDKMPLPEQQRRLAPIFKLKNFRKACIDYTGMGIGLTEYTQAEFGSHKIDGINFATTVDTPDVIKRTGRKAPKVRVTEAMATNGLQIFEDRRIRIPYSVELHDDLLMPERIVSASGRVSIAAERDKGSHADRFWGLMLALDAADNSTGPFQYAPVRDIGQTVSLGLHSGVII